MSDSDDHSFNKNLAEFDNRPVNYREGSSLNQSNIEERHDIADNINNVTSGSRGEDSHHPQPTNTQPMAATRLSLIVDQTPVVVFLEIVQRFSDFFTCLKRKTNTLNTIVLLSKAICKGTQVPFDENVKCLCERVVAEENFWNQFLIYLSESTVAIPTAKSFKTKSQNDATKNDSEIWQCVTDLCQAIVNHEVRLQKSFLKKAIQLAEENKNDHLVLDVYLTVLKKCWEYEKSLKDDAKSSRNLFPTLDELKSDTLAPRNSTIFNGKYKDVSQYLDVHLGLLREDFLLPVRDGFEEILSDTLHQVCALVYRNVKIKITEKEYRTIKTREVKKTDCIVADLGSKLRKRSGASTQDSDQNYYNDFLPGSVLFFTTSDEFNDLIIAKIQKRDTDLLDHGYIDIVIVKTFNISSIFNKEFIMYVRRSYFYREIYEVLKNFNENTFPLRSQLINVDTNDEYPSYVPDQKKVIYKYRKHKIDIKNPSSWPAPSAFNLNENHLNALKQSLTQKICAIPTLTEEENVFIASEIIATLFQNTNAQILIVCHSGNVLGKLLADIEMYTQDIARIENHGMYDDLDKFNLNEIYLNYSIEQIYELINAYRYVLHSGYRNAVEKFTELQTKMKEPGMQDNHMNEYINIQFELESFSKRLDEMKQITKFLCIKSKRIIGITSFTATKFETLIQLLQTPIVIIEGAQRILEAHTIATLTTNVQHLILIGERKKTTQDRHSNTVALSKFYKTHFSLFDRLINRNGDGMSNPTKNDISRGPSILDILLSKKRKESLPLVIGIEKFVSVLEYKKPKSTVKNAAAKVNEFESQFVLALCNYLLKQGYDPGDITILAITLEQEEKIRTDREMYKDTEVDEYKNLCKVHLDILKNYKGKNNGIILLSMVMAMNDESEKYYISREIQATLARTKTGVFIVGDVPWGKTMKKVQRGIMDNNAVGDEMALLCQTHGNKTKAKDAKDIDKLKFGGCEMLCNQPLACGHVCQNVCHTIKYKHSGCECNDEMN